MCLLWGGLPGDLEAPEEAQGHGAAEGLERVGTQAGRSPKPVGCGPYRPGGRGRWGVRLGKHSHAVPEVSPRGHGRTAEAAGGRTLTCNLKRRVPDCYNETFGGQMAVLKRRV